MDQDLDDSTLVIGPVIDIQTGTQIASPGTYNPQTRTMTWFVGEVGPSQGGYAEFSINVRGDVPKGTEVINFATVYFPSVPEATRTNGIVSIVGLDTTPPTTTASASPAPNVAGWNNTDVTVTLTAQDEADGTGVKELNYSLSGAQTGGGVVAGSNVSVTISTEGTTTLTYFAKDNAANQEAPKSLTIRVDKTPPAVTARRAPNPNASGWNNTDVTVSLYAIDNVGGTGVREIEFMLTGAQNGSGVVSGNVASVTITTEGMTTLTYFARDNAGNQEAPKSLTIRVDKTPPAVTARRAPNPNASGWNNTDVTVSLYAIDNVGGTGVREIEFMLTGAQNGSGVVSGNVASVTITTEGMTTLTYFARDNAGNQEAAQTLTVRIDKGVPELAAYCAPPGSPLVVVGRDGGSGVASVTLTDTVPLQQGEFTERWTYLILDLAGNQLQADFGVKAEGHEMEIALLGLTYNGTAAPHLPENELKCEWSLEKRTDAVKELEQKLTIEDQSESPRDEHDKTEVHAKFRAKRNETEIRIETAESEQQVTRPGLVFLHLTTDQGEVGFEH